MDVRKNLFSERVVRYCTAAPGVVGAPSLEVLRGPGDVALRDVGSGHGGVGWGWTWGS